MDILDQLNSQPSKSKKKTSILNNNSVSQSISFLPTPAVSQLQIQKQNMFMPRQDQQSSYQHLKNTHFDLTASSRPPLMPESHKDTSSMSSKDKRVVPIPQSLAVIVSQSSEESQNSANETVSRRQRMRDTTVNTRVSSTQNKVTPIQYEQMKEKLNASELKINEYQLKLKQLTKESAQKQQKIAGLQHKIDMLQRQNRQDRRQIIEQQSQILKVQLSKTNHIHEQDIKRVRQLLTWQCANKTNALQQQIASLNLINEKYRKLIQSESELTQYKNMILQSNNKEDERAELNKNNLVARQKQLEAKSANLGRKMEEFYQQKRQYDHKLAQMQNQINEQKLKIKKQRAEMMRELKERQQKREQQLRDKIQSYQSKARKAEIQTQETLMLRTILQKQKQNLKRLNQMTMAEHKKNMQNLVEERQRVYAKQKELLQKLQIVQARSRIDDKPSVKANKIQSEVTHNFLGIVMADNSKTIKQNHSNMSNHLHRNEKALNETATDIKSQIKKDVSKPNLSMKGSKSTSKGIYKLHQFYQ